VIADDATLAAGPTAIAAAAPGPSLASTPYGLVAAHLDRAAAGIAVVFVGADLSVRRTIAIPGDPDPAATPSVTALPRGPLLVAWTLADGSTRVHRICPADLL
jgi:hypothetical protein